MAPRPDNRAVSGQLARAMTCFETPELSPHENVACSERSRRFLDEGAGQGHFIPESIHPAI